jgi:hypothetical protein
LAAKAGAAPARAEPASAIATTLAPILFERFISYPLLVDVAVAALALGGGFFQFENQIRGNGKSLASGCQLYLITK